MDQLIPIYEMIAILYQWLLAKYTSVQNFPFWKVSGGFPTVNEIKRNLSRWLLANYTSVKIFACWKAAVTLYNFRVPFYMRIPILSSMK